MTAIDSTELAQYKYLSRHGRLLQQIATTLVATSTPTPVLADRALTADDNTNTLVCTGSRILTVNAGMPVGFGCVVKGLVTFTAGPATTVVDERAAGVVYPWCALVQTAADVYSVVGGTI